MRTLKNEAAFTLIELMIVICIIGILAAIAMPAYADYKKGAYDSEAKALLRQVATAQEAYYLDNDSYISCDQASCPVLLESVDSVADGVILQVVSTDQNFTATASHTKGSGDQFTWEG